MKMNSNLKRTLAMTALTCGLFGMTQAQAALTVFNNDLSGWSTAVGSSVVEDFSDTTLIPRFAITFGTFLPVDRWRRLSR